MCAVEQIKMIARLIIILRLIYLYHSKIAEKYIMQPDENRIREYAYQIWEAEGKPDGKAEQHWKLACESLNNEYSQHQEHGFENHSSNTFIPHQNTKVGKHAHHPHQPH